MSEQNKRVAIDFITAMGTNQLAAAAACMSPDGVMTAMGSGRFAGVHTPEMIAGSVDAMLQMVPGGFRYEISSITAEGDRVVVEARSNADIGEAEPFRNDYVFVFTMQDGKITQCNEYYCSVRTDEVLWPIAQRAGYGFE